MSMSQAERSLDLDEGDIGRRGGQAWAARLPPPEGGIAHVGRIQQQGVRPSPVAIGGGRGPHRAAGRARPRGSRAAGGGPYEQDGPSNQVSSQYERGMPNTLWPR